MISRILQDKKKIYPPQSEDFWRHAKIVWRSQKRIQKKSLVLS